MSVQDQLRSAVKQTKDHTQSPPNQRIVGRNRHSRPPTLSSLFFITTTILLFCTSTLALERQRFEIRRPVLEQWENDVVFDPRPTPKPGLVKRQFDPGSSPSSSTEEKGKASKTEEKKPSSTSTDEATGSGGIISAPTPTGSDLPTAFDGGLGTNFTQPSCKDFLSNMIKNETVTRCLPISLLLQNSQSFFQAARSDKSLDPVLTASCNVDEASCSGVMAAQALSLRSSNACSEDYDRQQPSVRQAYNGLVSYDLVYRAVCTKATPSPANNNSADFCYTNAVTNTSSPTDAYVYFLPLGVSLPAGSLPTCSQCLQTTMGLFGPASRNKSQPISLTYIAAAEQINLNCGPNFVNQNIPGVGGGSSAGVVTQPRLGAVVMTLAAALLVHAL